MKISHPPLDAISPGSAFRIEKVRTGEDGFTLVELALVLAVLAIILAIAIPTFLSTSNSANQRMSQQNLNTALGASSGIFQSNGQSFALGTPSQYSLYASLAAASLSTSQKNLTFTTKNSTGPSTVSVYVSAGGNGIVLANRSTTGTCWFAISNPNSISTTVNNAYALRPYGTGKSASVSTPSSKTGKAGAQMIFLPTASGTYYANVTGDGVSGDCKASNPILRGVGSEYQLGNSPLSS